MKMLFMILLFITLIITPVFAKIELCTVSGLNFGSIKFNDNDVNDQYNNSMKPGLKLGVEFTGSPFNFGVAFVQRGTKFTFDGDDIINTYNYFSGYVIVPIPIKNNFSVFSSFHFEKCINGRSIIKYAGNSVSTDLDAEDFGPDLGLTFGLNYMFSPSIGVRTSYYHGFFDVADGVRRENNFKNRGIEISLLYKI